MGTLRPMESLGEAEDGGIPAWDPKRPVEREPGGVAYMLTFNVDL